MRIFLSLAILIPLFFLSCSSSQAPGGPLPRLSQELRPKNIILMIGDGMGISHISAAMYANNNRISLEQFPIAGLYKPGASNSLINDSAAGATALASGVRTYNGAIGVNKDTMPVITILEEAEARGWATGIVTTSSITHATPAAFIAHLPLRNLHEQIALFFLETEIDCFIGGGMSYFTNQGSDDQNLSRELQKKGYIVSDYTQEDFSRFLPGNNRNFAFFTADKEPPTANEGRDYLPGATRLAANYLSKRGKEKGFFLMVEGAQIDWGAHRNDSEMIISEMKDFDQAIRQALEFAVADEETLVIVTADHETGGFSINPGSRQDSIIAGFTTTLHTASLVPVFAYGPGAELFAGIYDNTAIYHKMRQAFGFSTPAVN